MNDRSIRCAARSATVLAPARYLSIALIALLLTACGFHLRGAYVFPFKTASIEVPGALPEFAVQLKRVLQNEGSINVVESTAKPQARIRMLEIFTDKRILSLSSGGKVREFALEQRIRFDVVDENDRELLAPTTIAATRDFSFSDAQALAKEGEERLLRADMQSDLIAQVLRQLQAVRMTRSS
jgi:LPS-assembly lipoprotein